MSKGSKRRPSKVSNATLDKNWNMAFNKSSKTKLNDVKPEQWDKVGKPS